MNRKQKEALWAPQSRMKAKKELEKYKDFYQYMLKEDPDHVAIFEITRQDPLIPEDLDEICKKTYWTCQADLSTYRIKKKKALLRAPSHLQNIHDYRIFSFHTFAKETILYLLKVSYIYIYT